MTEEQNPDGPQAMTRLQLHNAARHVLKTAKEAKAAVARGEDDEIDEYLHELLLDFSAMTGRHDVLAPAVEGSEDIERLIQHVAEAAVFVGAHNWHPEHLHAILRGETVQEQDPHAGERLMKEFLDGLGTVRLGESGDAADWAFRVAGEAAAGDEMCTTVVKAAHYVLHPSVLMIFGDVTKLLGDAVYAKNLSQFDKCVTAIEGLTTELRPFVQMPVQIPDPEISAEEIWRRLGLEPGESWGPEGPREPEDPERLEESQELSALPLPQHPNPDGLTHHDPEEVSGGLGGWPPEWPEDTGEWGLERRKPPDDGTSLDL